MLDILLYDGFGDHAGDAESYARELEAAAEGEAPPQHLVQFAKVGAHTIGEHLGDWPRAQRLVERLLSEVTPTPQTAKAWGHLYVARRLAGDTAGAAAAQQTFCRAAGGDVRAAEIEMEFMLVAALVGSSRTSEAASLYEAALAEARELGNAAPDRAIAIASNNLASELLETPKRTPEETELMQAAAAAAHEFWLRCGDWVNHERALYLRAMVANALNDPATGLAHADAALALIAANGEAPVDETFLRLTRAHSLALLGDEPAAAAELELSDGDAGDWEDGGLIAWYAEERARVLPQAAPFEAA